jgi:heme-degrading monooxygenase HmoA
MAVEGVLSTSMNPETTAVPALASTPEPPYYAVIFSSTHKHKQGEDDLGYGAMAAQMDALVRKQPGFLGADSARGADGLGITVAYFDSLEAIREWKANAEHLTAQRLGRERWYRAYSVRICRVERAYAFESE